MTEALVTRDERGHWLPGVSGNPSGRDPGYRELVRAAREHSGEALAVLVEIATDTKAQAMARVRAAEILLDRGHGRVVAERDLGDDMDGERIVVRFRIGEADGAGFTAEELGPEK